MYRPLRERNDNLVIKTRINHALATAPYNNYGTTEVLHQPATWISEWAAM